MNRAPNRCAVVSRPLSCLRNHWRRSLGVLAALGLAAAPALAQYSEAEPNDTKAQATVIAAMAPGQTITGNSRGTSGTGAGSADYYSITTTAAPSAGLYRYRLTITSTIAGHTGTIRGLTQTAGVIAAGSDATVQTSSASTSPPRFNQWYAT